MGFGREVQLSQCWVQDMGLVFNGTFITVQPFVFFAQIQTKICDIYILFRLGLNILAPSEFIQISLSQEEVRRV